MPLEIRSNSSSDGAFVIDGSLVESEIIEGAGDSVVVLLDGPSKEASEEALHGPAYSPTQGERQFGPVQPTGQTHTPLLQVPFC